MRRCCCRGEPRGFTYRDLLIVLVIVPLVLVYITACQRTYYRGDNRIKCASNLKQIGQAILLYCNENKNYYPRTVYSEETAATPVWGTGTTARNPFGPDGPQPNDVSAALFLLLRTQQISAEVFLCPTASDYNKDVFGGKDATAADRSNFTDVKLNLAYSYANPYPDKVPGYKLHSSMNPEFPIAADLNPGLLPRNRDNVCDITQDSPAAQMRLGNSNNHQKDGQNVLYADGHVEFQQNPFCGVQRDNIYTRSGTPPAVIASPAHWEDSVMLPTDD